MGDGPRGLQRLGCGAWDYLPHDHARSRAYRWGEDGIAGFSDEHQYLCLSLALWNGKDPILKERLFGLTNSEGNHGEDVKELYYYLDATPSHSYLKMLYKYPQAAFPYSQLLDGKPQPRPRTHGVRAAGYGLVRRGSLLRRVRRIRQRRPRRSAHADHRAQSRAGLRAAGLVAATVLPKYLVVESRAWRSRRLDRPSGGGVEVDHPELGEFRVDFDSAPTLLFCDNDTNPRRLFGMNEVRGYFKDAFHEYLVQGRHDAVNPAQTGTKVGGAL